MRKELIQSDQSLDFSWSPRTDLNRQPADYKFSDLPKPNILNCKKIKPLE